MPGQYPSNCENYEISYTLFLFVAVMHVTAASTLRQLEQIVRQDIGVARFFRLG